MTSKNAEKIRELLDEILYSDIRTETKCQLIEGIDDSYQSEVVGELEKIKSESVYNRIISQPLISGNDLLRLPSELNDYLIDKFLWKGSILILVGQEKACKSIVTSQMCMSMTCGDSFLGCYDVARPLKVLYIQAEGSLADTKERLLRASLNSGIKWNPSNWMHYSPAYLCLDTDVGYNDIVQRLDSTGFVPDVIVYDPLYTLVTPGKSLNSDDLIRPFCGNVRKLNDRYKCASIVVHHEHRPKLDKFSNKLEEGDNAIYGSSMLKNFASHVIRISIVNERGNPIAVDKEEGDIKYRKLSCTTQRNGNVIDKVVLKLNQNPLMFEIPEIKTQPKSTKNTVFQHIQSKGIACHDDIVNDTGLGNQTVYNCFSALKKENKIKIHSKDNKKTFYCVNEEKLL